MRLIFQSRVDRRRENLLMATKLARILLDEFTDESQRDILLAVREPGHTGPQLHQIAATSLDSRNPRGIHALTLRAPLPV
jgi:hypothetical protein